MTKKQKKLKQSEKDHRPFRFQSLQERLNNININVVHRIRYYDTDELDNLNGLIQTSYFHQSLEHWSTLNYSEVYSKFYDQLILLASSLEQVVYNREQIVTLLRQSLNEHNPLIIETLLDLIVQLARDLQNDFYIYYKNYLFTDIIHLVVDVKKQQQNEINTQLLEQVFQCLTYLFKYLWRIMLKDLTNLYELYSKYLFSSSSTNTLTRNYEYIRSFAAESFAYLLRKIDNYQSFIDYLFDTKERDENELESLSLVFSETCQNVQSTFHSCTNSLLSSLFNKLIEKPEIIRSCIKTIYFLLIKHTNLQYVEVLWNCFIDNYHRINHNEEHNSLIYQTFYEIFQLFIDHQLIIDLNLCFEFLKIVTTKNVNNEFLKIHYETIFKLMKWILIDKQIIDIYYRFIEQTSSMLLYQETRKIFQSNINEKLSNEFYYLFWDQLIRKTNDKQQIIDYFVDFIIIERKRSKIVLLSNDHDQCILEKINLLKTKQNLLIQEKITNKGLELIQMFIQDTLSEIDETQILVRIRFIYLLGW